MDWFERLTGFREDGYAATKSRLEVVGDRLHSKVNGQHYGVGRFELVSLASLRERAHAAHPGSGRLRVSIVQGDVRRMHQQPAFSGALFQVASQFNMLPRHLWQAFATLILESAYEATLWAAVDNARRGASNVVLLTRLGGGAFGNHDDWIHAAMRRSLHMALGFDLDVRLVSHGPASPELLRIAQEFG